MEGIWRLGRGLALVATGRLPGAEGEHHALSGLTKQIRRTKSQEEKLERELLKIAERLLAGEISLAECSAELQAVGRAYISA